MMEPEDVLAQIVEPTLALLPLKMTSDEARVMLLAIGLQESRFEHRRQVGGPARGFWQFEQGGGVHGVLTHAASRPDALRICALRGVTPTERDVYQRLAVDDILACAFARLLLWTDPGPLPAAHDPSAAWALYLWTWRPGKPHPETWDALHARAVAAVTA
ncbi:hypothetical protein GCM10023144_01150 [Pigmentiphaga soli]|uniref:Uncharacterized protein n=1 Tax=Pigmentiphaga soli TaxID=1007095 RepID=A0ABP8GCW3_9BURK